MVLTRPLNGQVIRRQVHPGDGVTPDHGALLEIVDPSFNTA